MSAAPEPLSIFDLVPLEMGGVEARQGFAFQDHVSASFCIDMLDDATLAEVWCETLDDITLIWMLPDGICVEFVQVKSSELDQLWSVAKLCERKMTANGPGSCILERSLAQDRCKEPCRFRLVTARPTGEQLKVLTYPCDSPVRTSDTAAFNSIHEKMKDKVDGFRSTNGHDFTFWTARVFWDVRHAEDGVRDSNLLKLGRLLHAKGLGLAPDQINELYTKLLKRVWDASRVDPRVEPQQKRITRLDFDQWLTREASEIGLPSAGATEKLEDKMRRAALAPDTIETAVEQIRHYRSEQLRPKYLGLDDQRLIQGEVAALLQGLRSRLDNGQLADDGLVFHGLCLDELAGLRDALRVTPKPPLAFLQGCMYSITGRCLHRFRRVTA